MCVCVWGGGGGGGGVLRGQTYIHKSRTQGAPALRTGDGGLNIFDDRSTLPTHPVPKLSCIMTTQYVQIP